MPVLLKSFPMKLAPLKSKIMLELITLIPLGREYVPFLNKVFEEISIPSNGSTSLSKKAVEKAVFVNNNYKNMLNIIIDFMLLNLLILLNFCNY